MMAQVAYTALRDAARALKPYTTTPSNRNRLLYLHADRPVLTLSASTGDDTAAVALPEALGDGCCALPVDTLIAALAAIRPNAKATPTAMVGLHGDGGRLTFTLGDQPAIGLDTTTPHGLPPAVPVQPGAAERPVTTGPAADWCDLIGGVATAVDNREPARADSANLFGPHWSNWFWPHLLQSRAASREEVCSSGVGPTPVARRRGGAKRS